MSILVIAVLAIAFLAAGYFTYGRFVAGIFKLDDTKPTPAVQYNDGVDCVPAKASLLIGQHFSAIAAAGPIVGPILAGMLFGWVPALIWIVLGAIFIGGVHDLSSLIASVRHKGESIGQVVRKYMSPLAYVLFLCFVWLTLIYVIIAFTDITAQTFKTVAQGEAYGPAVAASSIIYLALGVAMGVCLYKFKMRLWLATSIFVPLVLFVVWLGPHMPAGLLKYLGGISVKRWDIFLLAYCFFASIVPMWLLLQPRGYLGGCFLYGTIFACLIGVLFGGYAISYPAFRLNGLASAVKPVSMFPLLFITVACGACSGFHAVVSSGTTSKQLAKESDARPIGYGAMILEAVVALFALCTLMMLTTDDPLLKKDPNTIYATGIARFLELLKLPGITFQVAFGFALLAFSTFVYDTLDVCTRLGRYVFQELTGWKGKAAMVCATLATLTIPLIFLMVTDPAKKAYLLAWPIFGASNQLLASLTLMAVSVWLIRCGKNALITLIPMAFMMVMTIWSLFQQGLPGWRILAGGKLLDTNGWVVTGSATVILVLALAVIAEAARILVFRRRECRELA
jgi:carbon starvation protein